jgi:hypothetical protein
MNALRTIVIVSVVMVSVAFATEPNFKGQNLYELFNIDNVAATTEEVITAVDHGLFAARPGANDRITASHYGLLRWGANVLLNGDNRMVYDAFLGLDETLRPSHQPRPTLMQQRQFLSKIKDTSPAEIRRAYTANPPYSLPDEPLDETTGPVVKAHRFSKWLCITVLTAGAAALGGKAADYAWQNGIKPRLERSGWISPAPAPASEGTKPVEVVVPKSSGPPAGQPPVRPVQSAPPVEAPAPKAEAPTNPVDAATNRGKRFGDRLGGRE